MKLFDRLPDFVIVDGKRYAMDFDFRNVLRMMEILARDDIIEDARNYLALKCVTKHPRNVDRMIRVVNDTLFDKTPSRSDKKITSFEQDAPLIRAAFRQVYGIDLYRERVHWLEFSELLRGLPEGNRYEEVIGIRARPMPPATKYNAKEREWLMQAKQQYALHLTDTEAAKKYEKDVSNIFKGVMGIIAKGEVMNSNGE